jgi:hypothetical protein
LLLHPVVELLAVATHAFPFAVTLDPCTVLVTLMV